MSSVYSRKQRKPGKRMSTSSQLSAQIHDQVLRAIVLNRTPGYHFCGNFLGLTFEGVGGGHARVTMPAQPALLDGNGCVDPCALTVLADFALANAVRAAATPTARLATVSLNLQLTGEPLAGDLAAHGELEGFFAQASGRLGMSRTHIRANGKVVAFGTGTFMVLPAPKGQTLHPIPWIDKRAPVVPLPEIETLSAPEREIVDRSQQALAALPGSHQSFWALLLGAQTEITAQGAKAVLANGPHVGNRVGHVQGGVSLALALISANAALGEHWRCTGMNASYVSPGLGPALVGETIITHRGRLTALTRTQVVTQEGKLVLDVMTHHARVN
jgi:acyl-coenzyme A thioesterase PaaI-like protein